MYMYMNTGTYKSGLTLPFFSEPPLVDEQIPTTSLFLSEPFEKKLSYPPHFLSVPLKTDSYNLSTEDTYSWGGGGDRNKNAKSHSPLQGQATGDVPSRQISTLSCTIFLQKNTKNRNLSYSPFSSLDLLLALLERFLLSTEDC